MWLIWLNENGLARFQCDVMMDEGRQHAKIARGILVEAKHKVVNGSMVFL